MFHSQTVCILSKIKIFILFIILLASCENEQLDKTNKEKKTELNLNDTIIALNEVFNYFTEHENVNLQDLTKPTCLIIRDKELKEFIKKNYSNSILPIEESELCNNINLEKDSFSNCYIFKYIERKSDSIYFFVFNKQCLMHIPKGKRLIEGGVAKSDTCYFAMLCGYTKGLHILVKNKKSAIYNIELAID
jgi:hypothetical protein